MNPFKQLFRPLSVNNRSLNPRFRSFQILGSHCSDPRCGRQVLNQHQFAYNREKKHPSKIIRSSTFPFPHLTSPFFTTAQVSSPPSTKSSSPGSVSGFGRLSDTPPTDFAALDVLGDLQGPAAGVEVITNDGFKLSNGIRVVGAGVLLVGGEAFKWRPWLAIGGDKVDGNVQSKNKVDLLKNTRGQWEIHESCWGLLDLVWPKPGIFQPFLCPTLDIFQVFNTKIQEADADNLDLLILGTGRELMPLAPQTRSHINKLGMRIEILDTRNAAAQYMLLATERGIEQVAAALVPLG